MSPSEDSERYRLAADVRFRKVGGEGVMVRQEAAEVVVVDGVGGAVLELLDPRRRPTAARGICLEDLTRALSADYRAPADTLRRDVEDFLRELLAAGVVEVVTPAG